MNSDKLQGLRELAKQATKGNWKWIIRGNSVQSHSVVSHDDSVSLVAQNICAGISPKTVNAAYIVAANPATVLQLLDEIERLREKTSVCMGVGDGSGEKFVYGNYESIKEAQRKLLALEQQASVIKILTREINDAQGTIERLKCCGNCLHYIEADIQNYCHRRSATDRHEKCDKWEGLK